MAPMPKESAAAPNTIRLLAVDLDGTLLNDAKQVTERTLRALMRLGQRDVKVVLASARPPRSVRHIFELLKLDTLQINYNGAMIWDQPRQKVMYHRPMDCQIVRRLIDEARDLYDEVVVSCEILDRWYTDRLDHSVQTETGRLFKPDVISPVEQFCNQPITKLLLLGDAPVILRLEAYLGDRYAKHVSMVRTDKDLIQIMHRRVSKGAALEKVAAYYNVAMDQVMAVGDAPNDVGMLKCAGVAVAVGNAHELVREVADWVAPSNNEDGVYAALQRYGLCD
jgi:Cof subfamily protein (haloacid dehalogenase superfamily)